MAEQPPRGDNFSAGTERTAPISRPHIVSEPCLFSVISVIQLLWRLTNIKHIKLLLLLVYFFLFVLFFNVVFCVTQALLRSLPNWPSETATPVLPGSSSSPLCCSTREVVTTAKRASSPAPQKASTTSPCTRPRTGAHSAPSSRTTQH